jgi:hypothetical protein
MSADDRVFAAVDELCADLQTPARRDPFSAAVGDDAIATPGGPAQTPARLVTGPAQTTRGEPGECLLPGSGAVFSGTVTESDAAVVAPVAGADRAGRPPAPGTDYPAWMRGWRGASYRSAWDLLHRERPSLPPPPAVRPFPERTPAFEIGTGPVYDALPKRR